MPSTKRPALSSATIDQARKTLAALPPPVPASHSVRQAVHQLKQEISHMRSLGYTFAQIAQHLNSLGIPVANSTLRNYASEPPPRKRGKHKPPPGVRKAPSPKKMAAAVAASPPSSPAAKPETKRGSTFVLKPDRIKV